jgi:hypothetical protein
VNNLLHFPRRPHRPSPRPLRRVTTRLIFRHHPNPWGPPQPGAVELLDCGHRFEDVLFDPSDKPARRRRCTECVKPGAVRASLTWGKAA